MAMSKPLCHISIIVGLILIDIRSASTDGISCACNDVGVPYTIPTAYSCVLCTHEDEQLVSKTWQRRIVHLDNATVKRHRLYWPCHSLAIYVQPDIDNLNAILAMIQPHWQLPNRTRDHLRTLAAQTTEPSTWQRACISPHDMKTCLCSLAPVSPYPFGYMPIYQWALLLRAYRRMVGCPRGTWNDNRYQLAGVGQTYKRDLLYCRRDCTVGIGVPLHALAGVLLSVFVFLCCGPCMRIDGDAIEEANRQEEQQRQLLAAQDRYANRERDHRRRQLREAAREMQLTV